MSQYDDMPILEVIRDFVQVRGDIGEDYAQRQLADAMRRKLVRIRGDAAGSEYRAFLRGMEAACEADSTEVFAAIAAAWDEGYEAGGGDEAMPLPNPYREGETA